MNPPSGDELEAVKRLAARPEGQVVLGYLQRNANAIGLHLMHESDDVKLRTLQGQSQVLAALLMVWKP